MNNGIIYFKRNSQYEGDFTKGCSLSGSEVDNNFFTLEGRDVKAISVENNDIVLTLVNGNKLKAKDALDNFIVGVKYDAEKGDLILYRNNGEVERLHGFKEQHKGEHEHHTEVVSVNDTMIGNGSKKHPIGVSPMQMTGQYRPVDYIAEKDKHCEHFEHEHKHEIHAIGERVVNTEKISAYGALYTFKGVCDIACKLQRSNSKWRIPTKEDWDDMLNAVEPVEFDRKHNSNNANAYLGKWAGTFLKSADFWKLDKHFHHFDEHKHEHHCEFEENHHNEEHCHPSYCGELGHHDKHHYDTFETKGIDKFGFGVVPAGYADDGGNMAFFDERASFWTSTNIRLSNVFVKRFEYNRSNVHQDIVAGENYMSLRLVKDYDGDNYNEFEEILGQTYPTVLMPSEKHGSKVWTAVNVYFTDKHCEYAMPNYGQGMVMIKKYFIDEWDGHKWNRNEIKEGESFVVKKAPNGKHDVEYRIIDNRIVEVNKTVYDTVIDELNPKLDDLDEKIEQEITRSTMTDSLHDEQIADLAETKVDWTVIEEATDETEQRKAIVLKNHDEILGTMTDGTQVNVAMVSKWDVADFGSKALAFNINYKEGEDEEGNPLRPTVNDTEKLAYLSDIETLGGDTEEKVQELDKKIDDVKEELEKTIDETKKELENTIEETKEALENEINSEQQAREAADEKLSQDLNDETTKREEADAELKQGLESEVSAREEAVSNEAKAREEKDAEHDQAIEEINSKLDDTNNALDEEIKNREQADNEIKEALETETNAREEADKELDEALKAEVEAREAKNTEHETELERLEGAKIDWHDESTILENKPREMRNIWLTNNSKILSKKEADGEEVDATVNIAHVSIYDKVELGDKELSLNLNTNGRPTVNSEEDLAYISDVENLKDNSEASAKELDDKITAVDKKLDEAVEKIEQEIEDETAARSEADAEITNKLISEVKFDEESGKITISKVGEEEEDIVVQLTMNFGTF